MSGVSRLLLHMMNLFGKLFKVTCGDTSSLVSEMLDHNLPFERRLRVRIHLAICKVCRCYQDQMVAIRSLASRFDEINEENRKDTVLPEASRRRIKEMIRTKH